MGFSVTPWLDEAAWTGRDATARAVAFGYKVKSRRTWQSPSKMWPGASSWRLATICFMLLENGNLYDRYREALDTQLQHGR